MKCVISFGLSLINKKHSVILFKMPARKKIFFLSVLIALTPLSFNVLGVDTNVATNTITLDVPEVALLKSNTTFISLSLTHQDAGMPIESSKSDSTARLHISSVITSSTRSISAMISFGNVPAGTNLLLSARNPNSNFVGLYGNFEPPVILDATNKTIVSGIGTCYSGTSADDGYIMRYTFALDSNPLSYGLLRATVSSQVTVTLTLTAAQ